MRIIAQTCYSAKSTTSGLSRETNQYFSTPNAHSGLATLTFLLFLEHKSSLLSLELTSPTLSLLQVALK